MAGVIVVPGLPIGYRFLPTPDVLIRNYLKNKNLNETLPTNVIPEIHANKFYSMPPYQLVADTPCTIENEWYYFIRGDSYFCGEKKGEHTVGNGDGFWRGDGEENPIIDKKRVDTEGVLGYQTCYDYFSGSVSNPEEEEWKLEKYRMAYKCDEASKGQKEEGWVVGKIIKGDGYVSD